VRFDGQPRPTLGQLLERAEAMGGMALRADGCNVSLVDFPDAFAAVDFPDEPADSVDVTDYQQDRPVVVVLMEHALVALGGQLDPAPEPLPLPLTPAFVRRDRWRKRWLLRTGCLLFCLVLVVFPTAVVAALWGAWKGVRWLIGA
jgi:hypothetical protein